MEFKENVPGRIKTVLLPTGTLEPHGVINNGADMTTPYPAAGTWSAVPFPSSIGLYQKNQGYPIFDKTKADLYYKKVCDKVANLINEIVGKWDKALN